MNRSFILRGYIRRAEDGAYQAICLTLNLAVRGRSIEEAEAKLTELITAYLQDAHQSGNWNDLVPRPAPVSYYLEYYRLRILSHFRTIAGFKLFVRSAPDCMAHA